MITMGLDLLTSYILLPAINAVFTIILITILHRNSLTDATYQSIVIMHFDYKELATMLLLIDSIHQSPSIHQGSDPVHFTKGGCLPQVTLHKQSMMVAD
jgi:hypothetical protein